MPPAWMNTLRNSGTQQNAQYRPNHGYLSGYRGSRPGLMSGPTAITAGSAGSNNDWWNQPGGAGAPRGMPGATGAPQPTPQTGGNVPQTDPLTQWGGKQKPQLSTIAQQPQGFGQGNWASPYSTANSGYAGHSGGQPQSAWGGGYGQQGQQPSMAQGIISQMYGG